MSSERVLLETGANMWRGKEALGGKLTITSTKLRFQPHALNSTTAPFEMERSTIAGVERYNSMGIVPNGLLLRSTSGEEHRFVVMNRKGALVVLEQRP